MKNNKLLFIKNTGTRGVPSGGSRKMGLFLCDCGSIKEICISNVKRGTTKSCGCNSLDQIKKLGKRAGKLKASYIHGFFGTRFYKIYASAKSRCDNKNSTSYRFYGAVGVKFDYKSFFDFKEDLYKSYTKHVQKYGEKETTLDRIDSRMGYRKGNCKWSTYKEQARNRKDNRFVTIDGKTLVLAEWMEKKKTSKWYILKKGARS